MVRVLGIIGAGKLGVAIGRAAADAGWQVLFYDTAPAESVHAAVASASPDAQLVTLPELAETAEIVVIAVPFAASRQLDLSLLNGKVVLDPTNYWPAVDGPMPEFDRRYGSTSAQLAYRNPRMRLVKSLNHLSYHDFTSDARSSGITPRRAIAVASDDRAAQELVAQLVNDIGFDPVLVPFDRAGLLEPDGPVFGHWLDSGGMHQALRTASDPQLS